MKAGPADLWRGRARGSWRGSSRPGKVQFIGYGSLRRWTWWGGGGPAVAWWIGGSRTGDSMLYGSRGDSDTRGSFVGRIGLPGSVYGRKGMPTGG